MQVSVLQSNADKLVLLEFFAPVRTRPIRNSLGLLHVSSILCREACLCLRTLHSVLHVGSIVAAEA